jgi:hypothetical protein
MVSGVASSTPGTPNNMPAAMMPKIVTAGGRSTILF